LPVSYLGANRLSYRIVSYHVMAVAVLADLQLVEYCRRMVGLESVIVILEDLPELLKQVPPVLPVHTFSLPSPLFLISPLSLFLDCNLLLEPIARGSAWGALQASPLILGYSTPEKKRTWEEVNKILCFQLQSSENVETTAENILLFFFLQMFVL